MVNTIRLQYKGIGIFKFVAQTESFLLTNLIIFCKPESISILLQESSSVVEDNSSKMV